MQLGRAGDEAKAATVLLLALVIKSKEHPSSMAYAWTDTPLFGIVLFIGKVSWARHANEKYVSSTMLNMKNIQKRQLI
jgi:hypothetical protein